MDFLRCSTISRNSDFQLLAVSNNNFQSNNNGELLLNNLNESLNKNLTQSVFDSMKCFICLETTVDPLSCPKCNNFACKECLKKYFGRESSKKCPLCKQDINFNELKENKLIEEIKNILYSGGTKEDKIKELSDLIEEKKRSWEDQDVNIKFILEKMFNYRKSLEDYKKEYELFLLNCQKVILRAFKDYITKIENLINSLLQFNEVSKESMKKYDNINERNKKNAFNNININAIKDLTNEILSMERKHFNKENSDETEQFLYTPIKIIPSLNLQTIRDMRLIKDDFNSHSSVVTRGNHYKLGEYKIIYNYSTKNRHKAICQVTFTLKKDTNACFLLTQNKILRNEKEIQIPMKLVDINNNTYTYQCIIYLEEFDIGKEKEVKMRTEALGFSL